MRPRISPLSLRFPLYALPLVLASACSSIDCPVENSVYSNYALMKGDQQTDTLKDTMFVVTFLANRHDTVLFNAGIGLTSFSLPMGYTTPEDTLYFLFRNGSRIVLDTVGIKKENLPHFESVDCKASYFHRLTEVRTTHNAIDSIVINSRDVDYQTTRTHFHLYLKHQAP